MKHVLFIVIGILFLFSLDSFTQSFENSRGPFSLNPFISNEANQIERSKFKIIFRCESDSESYVVAKLKEESSSFKTKILLNKKNRFYNVEDEVSRSGDVSEYSHPDRLIRYYLDWKSGRINLINEHNVLISQVRCSKVKKKSHHKLEHSLASLARNVLIGKNISNKALNPTLAP
ncbi:MAG TPA: hypothetical protein PLJ21_00525 [Pseudobdellovibrionaceae bacterium]|nr:hypothetical protein [Pseudobdellovibrionaceae bacterium]